MREINLDDERVKVTTPAASSDSSTGETSACGPGCNCGAPSGNNKMKVTASLVVLLAVGGIFIFKAVSARHNNTPNTITQTESSFALVPAGPNPVSGAAEDSAVAETGSMSELPKDSRKIGDYLDSLSMLNQVAMNQDAVFVYIPAKTDDSLDSKASDAVLSAQKTLTAKNLKIGIYTLKTSSAEYAKLTSQAQPPSFLVASKGKGMSAVSGEVTETKLLQAFTASSRAGGGCGPSSGCKPGAGC